MSAPINVWMSAWRTGEKYHRVVAAQDVDLRTACGRLVKSGEACPGFLMPDWEAERDKGATPCERCWPEGRTS